MLENYPRIQDFPALPRLRMGNVQDYFASLPTDGLPKAVGELYLELHRGTLTSQAKVKENNRKGEQRMFEAEVFSAIASLDGYEYPAEQLEGSWKTLLLNQFHDILPGSSINEVYIDSHQQMDEAIELAECLRDRVLASGVEPSANTALIVANASLYPRPLTVLVPRPLVDSISSNSGLTTQTVHEGTLVTSPGMSVPALGSIDLDAAKSGVRMRRCKHRRPMTASCWKTRQYGSRSVRMARSIASSTRTRTARC